MTRHELDAEMVARNQYRWWRSVRLTQRGRLLLGAYIPWTFLRATRSSGMTFWGVTFGNWHLGLTYRTPALTPEPRD